MADIWSSGVTLFAMIDGDLPFDEPDKHYLYKKIINCEYKMPPRISDEVKDLIRQIFVSDPKRRITLDKIKRHRWFKKHGQD